MKFVEWFTQGWSESTIVSGILALSLTGAVIYLGVMGRPVPEVMATGFGAVVTYFFVDKGRKDVQRMLSKKEG